MGDDPFPGFILCIMLVLGAFFIGVCAGVDGMQNKAIKNKAAFYDVDPNSGQVKFVWKNELLERPQGSLN